MKRSWAVLLMLGFALLALALWRQSRVEEEEWTVLSFRIGQPFEDVVRGSSYAVIEHSNVPADNLMAGQTYVTKPAVVLIFDDPKHGFRLPATKFAALMYLDNKVQTLATSPMLEKLPFDQAVLILQDLQNQFKTRGWEPWPLDGSIWFDLTPDGKRRLYRKLLQPGFSHETTLRVPGKYSMVFRIWCAEGCDMKKPPYLFLIDVGLGPDVYSRFSPDAVPNAVRGY